MNREEFAGLLARWMQGGLTEESLYLQLRGTMNGGSAINSSGDVNLDLDRASRCGNPEVVYGPGKTPAVVVDVFQRQIAAGQRPFLTRATEEQFQSLREDVPSVTIDEVGRTAGLFPTEASELRGDVIVVSAGTSDLPVAREAAATAQWMGCRVDLITDVGVAGPQRLLQSVNRLQKADAICVVAGMEGALPSVVAGWVKVPVIAVPTSVGYGVHLNGVAPLFSMLTSCAANVAVVNIDAGFKGGYLAGLIARSAMKS